MEPIKLTVKEANEVYAGLQNLDVYTEIVKDEKGENKTVSLPYKLKPKARYAVTKALGRLKKENEEFISNRDTFIKEISGGSGTINETETEKMKLLTAKLDEILDEPADTTGLVRIKWTDLNLDECPIPCAILNLLDPILDYTGADIES
jgi:CRISPR/Cas system CSM-associated protein Csm2 small subunit